MNLIVGSLLEKGIDLIDSLYTSDSEKAEAQMKLQELAQKGDLAELNAHVSLLKGQMDINKEEAKGNWFQAGWRPFVGWVCGIALAYVAILEPILRFVAKVFFGYTGEFPVIDTTLTMQVLIGMLGLGVYRMREKEKGVAK
tara:strand:- start:172 stop:594 length:423 start_codon:yes stop_codon:yes gene_type:complete